MLEEVKIAAVSDPTATNSASHPPVYSRISVMTSLNTVFDVSPSASRYRRQSAASVVHPSTGVGKSASPSEQSVVKLPLY